VFYVGACGTGNLISLISKVSRNVMAVLCLWNPYVTPSSGNESLAVG
jgi:hypothetical protein